MSFALDDPHGDHVDYNHSFNSESGIARYVVEVGEDLNCWLVHNAAHDTVHVPAYHKVIQLHLVLQRNLGSIVRV